LLLIISTLAGLRKIEGHRLLQGLQDLEAKVGQNWLKTAKNAIKIQIKFSPSSWAEYSIFFKKLNRYNYLKLLEEGLWDR
jgi:hypothetical protein